MSRESRSKFLARIAPAAQRDFPKGSNMAKGRPRKADVARTPSGQISRAKTGGLYFVYIAYFPSLGVLKVGRTGDVTNRMCGLRTEMGDKPVVCAEYRFATSDESHSCEAEAIKYLAGHCTQKRGREWFSVVADRLPSLLAGFYPKSVRALDVKSLGQHQNASHAFDAWRVRKQVFGHRSLNQARM